MIRTSMTLLSACLLAACSAGAGGTPAPLTAAEHCADPASATVAPVAAPGPDPKEAAEREAAFGAQSRFAQVNGVKLHYLFAGSGPAIVLLHGYAETSRMWLPLIAQLAKTNTVIAP